MKSTLQILLLFCASTSFLFSQESKTVKMDGFMMTLSSDWTSNEQNGRTLYILGSEYNSGNFMVTLDMELINTSQNVNEFAEQHKSYLKNHREFGNLEIKKQKEFRLIGTKAISYYSTATTAGIPIEIISVTVRHKNSSIAVLKFIAHWFNDASREKDFGTFNKTIQPILNSINVE